jgi:hypothetical protein
MSRVPRARMDTPQTIFLIARGLADDAARAAYLAEACGADAGLRQQVEAMLHQANDADSFFAFSERPREDQTTMGPAPG